MPQRKSEAGRDRCLIENLTELISSFGGPVIDALAMDVAHDRAAATPRAHIEVRNPATSDGVVTYQFTPQGGIAKTIPVEVKKGWDAPRIAREIAAALTRELPQNYRATSRKRGNVNIVDVDKDARNAADFDISKIAQTVQGTSVIVKYVP